MQQAPKGGTWRYGRGGSPAQGGVPPRVVRVGLQRAAG
jgi:hypothetical protein